MAMLIFRSADTTATPAQSCGVSVGALYRYWHEGIGLEVLVGAICALEEGRLPGNLGDTPEALATGESNGRQQLLRTVARQPQLLELRREGTTGPCALHPTTVVCNVLHGAI